MLFVVTVVLGIKVREKACYIFMISWLFGYEDIASLH